MSLRMRKMVTSHVFACSSDAIGNGVGPFCAQTAQSLRLNKNATVSYLKR